MKNIKFRLIRLESGAYLVQVKHIWWRTEREVISSVGGTIVRDLQFKNKEAAIEYVKTKLTPYKQSLITFIQYPTIKYV